MIRGLAPREFVDFRRFLSRIIGGFGPKLGDWGGRFGFGVKFFKISIWRGLLMSACSSNRSVYVVPEISEDLRCWPRSSLDL